MQPNWHVGWIPPFENIGFSNPEPESVGVEHANTPSKANPAANMENERNEPVAIIRLLPASERCILTS